MFESLLSYTRLMVCSLASLGLHAGIISFAWTQGPTVVVSANIPVEVSLVTLASSEASMKADLSMIAPALKPVIQSKTSTKPLAQKVPVKKAALVKAPVVKKPPEPILKPSVEMIESLPDEMVCMVPQDIIAENPPSFESRMQNVLNQSSLSTQGALKSVSSPLKVQTSLVEDEGLSEPLAAGGTATLVEAMPNYRSNPLPEYPFLARQKHWEGVVWLQVKVSAEGRVDELDLERSCGYKVLDRSASRAVRRWQFTPARRAGVPVESRVRIPVRFRLEDS